jgi:hypothetical protein
MASWVHRQTAHWDYFMPNDTWVPVESTAESTNSLDVSSAKGDALVSVTFAQGPQVPTTVGGVEDILWMTFASYAVQSQSAVVAAGPGQERMPGRYHLPVATDLDALRPPTLTVAGVAYEPMGDLMEDGALP